MNVEVLSAGNPTWPARVDALYKSLDYPDDPALFPLHFVTVVLPKIGGTVLVVADGHELVGAGLLFPMRLRGPSLVVAQKSGTGSRCYRCRCHTVAGKTLDWRSLLPQINEQTGAKVVLYHPREIHTYRQTNETVGSISIGHPSKEEATAVRLIHQEIWQNERGALYPADIHSQEFGLATSLVARVGKEIAGFLFGFYKVGTSSLPAPWLEKFSGKWRVESQVLGVQPAFRGQRIGFLLKRAQGELALRQDIALVNWTADPLQFPNAALNFGLLRAVAFDFYPDLYPFRNDLNRVPASRLGLSWLPGTERVRAQELTGSALHVDLSVDPLPVANAGTMLLSTRLDAEFIGIEIPGNWTELQHTNLHEALRWREITDQLFRHYLGFENGKYAITGVGFNGRRRYLIAERSTPSLWQNLLC